MPHYSAGRSEQCALNEEAQAARQSAINGIDMFLDERVMCAAVCGLAWEHFIVRPTQDQGQDTRCGLEHLINKHEALTIGKDQVKEDHFDTRAGQAFKRIVSRLTYSTRDGRLSHP